MVYYTQQRRLLDPQNSINVLMFSPDGAFLASGDDDGILYIYEVRKDWQVAHKISGPSRVTALVWDLQDGRLSLYAGFGDGTVLLNQLTSVRLSLVTLCTH